MPFINSFPSENDWFCIFMIVFPFAHTWDRVRKSAKWGPPWGQHAYGSPGITKNTIILVLAGKNNRYRDHAGLGEISGSGGDALK